MCFGFDVVDNRRTRSTLGRSDEGAITIIRTHLPSGRLTAFLIAGAVTGLLGVALFGAIHAAIIVPIWTRLTGGIPFGVVAGLAIGWAFYELRGQGTDAVWKSGTGVPPVNHAQDARATSKLHQYRGQARLNAGVIGALAFGFLLWATLIPVTLFGVIVRATGIHGQDDTWEVVLECVLTFGTGAIAGRLISGRWRAALALGTASLALTFAQAGPIPVMNSGRAASLFAALTAVYLFCVIALEFVASVASKFLRRPA